MQKVTIIPFNADEIVNKIYTACRTCYAKGTPQEQYETALQTEDNSKKWKLINHVISSGHHSTLEHVTFTFLITGVSRALSHQLVRHRIGINFSQQSQRYCRFDSCFDFVIPPSIANSALLEKYQQHMKQTQELYSEMVNALIPAEDARMVMPNACCTNLTVTVNLRELIHFCNERCCTCAQWEIRKMANQMAKLVYTEIPELKQYLGPKCQALGYCNESKDRTCGRKPLKNDALQNVYSLSEKGE